MIRSRNKAVNRASQSLTPGLSVAVMGCSGSKPALEVKEVDIKVTAPPAAAPAPAESPSPAASYTAPAAAEEPSAEQMIAKALKQLAGHRADPKVCAQTFETIAPLCAGVEGTKLAMSHGVLPFAVKSMKAHTADAATQRWGCVMIANILDSPTLGDELGTRLRAQVTDAGVAAMRAHPADPTVQKAGLSLLTSAANSPDELEQLKADVAGEVAPASPARTDSAPSSPTKATEAAKTIDETAKQVEKARDLLNGKFVEEGAPVAQSAAQDAEEAPEPSLLRRLSSTVSSAILAPFSGLASAPEAASANVADDDNENGNVIETISRLSSAVGSALAAPFGGGAGAGDGASSTRSVKFESVDAAPTRESAERPAGRVPQMSVATALSKEWQYTTPRLTHRARACHGCALFLSLLTVACARLCMCATGTSSRLRCPRMSRWWRRPRASVTIRYATRRTLQSTRCAWCSSRCRAPRMAARTRAPTATASTRSPSPTA